MPVGGIVSCAGSPAGEATPLARLLILLGWPEGELRLLRLVADVLPVRSCQWLDWSLPIGRLRRAGGKYADRSRRARGTMRERPRERRPPGNRSGRAKPRAQPAPVQSRKR